MVQLNMKHIQKLSKDEINECPLRSYRGKIHFVTSRDHVDDAVQYLSQDRVLGFDTESKPNYVKGNTSLPALLQLAGADKVFIFRLVDLGLPDALCELLANPSIVKAGVALRDDIKDLCLLNAFNPGGFVDLGIHSKSAGMQHHGLKGLAAILLDFRISKSSQRSNWAHPSLTEKQLRYAATDAWLGRELYFEMLRVGAISCSPLPIISEP